MDNATREIKMKHIKHISGQQSSFGLAFVADLGARGILWGSGSTSKPGWKLTKITQSTAVGAVVTVEPVHTYLAVGSAQFALCSFCSRFWFKIDMWA